MESGSLSRGPAKTVSRVKTAPKTSNFNRLSQSRMNSMSGAAKVTSRGRLATASRAKTAPNTSNFNRFSQSRENSTSRATKVTSGNRMTTGRQNQALNVAKSQPGSTQRSASTKGVRIPSSVRGPARDQLNKLVDQSKFNELTKGIPNATSRATRNQGFESWLPGDTELPASRRPGQVNTGDPTNPAGLLGSSRVGNLNDASFRELVTQSRSGGDRNSQAMDLSARDAGVGVAGAVGGQVGAAIATADGVAKTMENPTVTNVADTVASAVGLSPNPVAGAFSTAYGITRMVDEGIGIGDAVVDELIAEMEGKGAGFGEGQPVEEAPEQTAPDADPNTSALGPASGDSSQQSGSQSGSGSNNDNNSSTEKNNSEAHASKIPDPNASALGPAAGGSSQGGSQPESGSDDGNESGGEKETDSNSSTIPDPNTSALGPNSGGNSSGGGAGEEENGRPNPMQDDLRLDAAAKTEIERAHAETKVGLVNPGFEGTRQFPSKDELMSADRSKGNPRQGWAVNPGTGHDQRAITDMEAAKARIRNGLADPPKPTPGSEGVGPITNDVDRPDPKNPPSPNPGGVGPQTDA